MSRRDEEGRSARQVKERIVPPHLTQHAARTRFGCIHILHILDYSRSERRRALEHMVAFASPAASQGVKFAMHADGC